MLKKQIFILILSTCLPIILAAQNVELEPVKLIKKDEQTIEQTTTNQADTIVQDKQSEQNTDTITKDDIENQIEQQNKLLEKVIENINDESYLKTLSSNKIYNEHIEFLTNRININKKLNNTLAVQRDELDLILTRGKLNYENTLKSIILAKQEYKDKKYFVDLINKNIDLINSKNLDEYKDVYELEKNHDNKISSQFVENYIDLYNQSNTQQFVLTYLLENMSKYRPTNFFIDEFNLQYLVDKIDSLKGISFVSKLTSYYLKFSIGEIAVVIFIIFFFRLLNKYIISLLANFISRIFVKAKDEDSESIRQYLRMSIDSPMKYALYTLAIQISIFILIKDEELINTLMPWINTVYIAILTWAIYAVINNSINIYAHTLLEKYPNVRKEMIVFLLRIVKIILIMLVLLFLLSQLGIDIKAIAASLGVGGIAVALASKDTLANFFGSLNIMTDNSFSQGDWIKTPEVEGTVVDIRMRTTRIRTFDNAMITIPNSQLANSHIMNWSKRRIGRRIKMSLGITYESEMSDIKNLKDDIFEMLKNHPEIATDLNTHITKTKAFEVAKREDLQGVKNTLLVYIDEFAGSSINILIYCFSKSPAWEDWLKTKEDVIMKISALCDKNNCEIAYPTQAITIKNPTQIATMQDNSKES